MEKASRDRDWWRAQLQRIEQEGLTTKAYADREGIATTSLYYWRKVFKQEERQQNLPLARAVPSRFMALTRAGGQTPATPASTCTLTLPSGLRLEMTQLPSPAWLAALGAHLAQANH